jgi:hypothetical protein
MAMNKKLRQALTDWEQARDNAVLENVAWALLQRSRDDIISGYKATGLSLLKAQKQFQKHMDAHQERFDAALKRLSKASDEYRRLLKKHGDKPDE